MFFLLLCQSETNDVISRSETSVAAGPFLNNFIKEQKHKQWRVYFWWIYYDGRHLGEEMALQAWTTGTPKNIHIHIRNSLLLRARKLSNHIPRSTVRSTQQRQKDHFPLPLYCYTIHIDRQQKKERLKRATETWFRVHPGSWCWPSQYNNAILQNSDITTYVSIWWWRFIVVRGKNI